MAGHASTLAPRLALARELGRASGELTVAIGDSARCVRPPAERYVLVVDRDVRVVVLGLGELAHPIDEHERIPETSERERALERVVDLAPPIRDGHIRSITIERGR